MGCSIPTVQNFLCCLTLETGGLICGWLTAIFSAIGVISLAAGAIVALVTFGTWTDENKGSILAGLSYSCEKSEESFKKVYFPVLLVIYIIYIIYLCVVCYAAIQLVKGTKNVNENLKRLSN